MNDIPALRGSVLLAQNLANKQSKICHIIESTGAKVTLVENGQKVFEYTISTEFDLIIMDIHMPILDGVATLKGLRQLGYGKPVYALTNLQPSEEQLGKYRQIGFKGVLAEPIERSTLYAVLHQHLSLANQQVTAKTDISNTLKAKIAELKPKFLAALKIQYEQLSESIEHNDVEQIAKILHILKGSAGNFGYDTLTDVANSALISLRLEHFDKAPALIAKVVICINKILSDEESCDPQN
tara:strand:+ start:602 stop:1321 length:720 start_codon:yes stop_codon:yes gene_type:complete